MGRLHVGTSGYSYMHWRGVVYPPKLAPRFWLPWYARYFDCVELNATFYRLPPPAAARGWAADVPKSFRFAVKGSRYLTHMKRLLDRERGVTRFLDAIADLGEKRGPILWQLPAQMKHPDPPRLAAFLDALPKAAYAFEFRSAEWLSDEVLQILSDRGVALVIHDLLQVDWPWPPPGRFIYWRFHGATAPYSGRYGSQALELCARRVSDVRRPAWVFFNNDLGGHAFEDALTLKQMLGLPAGETRTPHEGWPEGAHP